MADLQTLGIAYVAVLVTLELVFWVITWRTVRGFMTLLFGDDEDE